MSAKTASIWLPAWVWACSALPSRCLWTRWPSASDGIGVSSAEAKPITRVLNNKVAPYTLVHCASDMGDAESYDVWGSVAWWYTHLIDFAIEWELPPMSEEQLRERFPNLEAARNGSFDPLGLCRPGHDNRRQRGPMHRED